LGISQEKLAEMANLSIQMVTCIEGQRAWVSDKTLISLSKALGMEVFQLFSPSGEEKKLDYSLLSSHWLLKLRQDMKAAIGSNIDTHFERIFKLNL
jgi:transcriptional regulator with XRE-family HTH domain